MVNHPNRSKRDAALKDAIEALKLARECIAYCRRNHPDPQKGDGFPAEMIIDAALKRAEAA